MFFLVGTRHSVCRSARLPVRVSSAELTGGVRAVWWGKRPGVFSVPPPNALISQRGGPLDRRKTYPKRGPPSPRVLGRQSPFSLPHVDGCPHWARLHHTQTPLEKPAGRECVVLLWLPTAPHRRHSGRVESSPHTTSHSQPGAGRRGLCSWSCYWACACARAKLEPVYQLSPLCLFVHHGGLGPGQPWLPASRKRGWGIAERPAGAVLCRAGSPDSSLPAGGPGFLTLLQLWSRTAWC